MRPNGWHRNLVAFGVRPHRAISLGGCGLIAGQHGGHRFKHAIASNQCVEQGGRDMQQDRCKECKGEIEVRVPQQRMQAVALRQDRWKMPPSYERDRELRRPRRHDAYCCQMVTKPQFLYGVPLRAILLKEIAMKKQTSCALTAALLLLTVTVASAATMSSHTKPSDTLNLTSTQQKTAWKDLYMPSLNQKAPSGFSPTVGSVIPDSVTAAAVPSKAARSVPSLQPYDFVMVQGKLLIVNPSDKKIAEVITG
jgi:hypothetical protein